MATIGNFTTFRAKHVTGIKFGSTAWSDASLASTTIALDTSFATNNATPLIDLTGTADTNNPTTSYAFARDFSTSGNEISSTDEAFLGADAQGSQNSEIAYGAASAMDVEMTVVYRNPKVSGIFASTTVACLVTMDNDESSTTGFLNIAFNNVVMLHVGSLTRNSDGLMEQKVKFRVRGGTAGSEITCTQSSPAETWKRYRLGSDYAEEVRTA